MLYQPLYRELYNSFANYLITGDLAIYIHGLERMVTSVDIFAEFNKENLRAINHALSKLNYKPLHSFPIEMISDPFLRRRLIKKSKLDFFKYVNSEPRFFDVNIMLEIPIDFDILWNMKEIRQFDDIRVYIISLNNLIAIKKKSNEPRNKQDAALLSDWITKKNNKSELF